jgi:hypothetical protein
MVRQTFRPLISAAIDLGDRAVLELTAWLFCAIAPACRGSPRCGARDFCAAKQLRTLQHTVKQGSSCRPT